MTGNPAGIFCPHTHTPLLGTNEAVVPKPSLTADVCEVRESSTDSQQPDWQGVAQDLQAQNNELASDRDLADREVRRLRKEAELLRRELQQVREADPRSKAIREVLDYWVKALGKSSRTKCPPNGARWNKVRARLNDGFTVDQLKQAIDGCAKFPFVGPKGRQADAGGGAKRHDDIELVCRDETTVERFIGYAKQQQKPNLTVVTDAPQAPGWSPALSPVERVLERLPAAKALDGGLMSRCPVCHGDLFVRTLARPSGELVLVDCYGNPACDRSAVMLAAGLNAGDMVSTRPVLNEFPAPFRLEGHLADAMRQMLQMGVLEERAA